MSCTFCGASHHEVSNCPWKKYFNTRNIHYRINMVYHWR